MRKTLVILGLVVLGVGAAALPGGIAQAVKKRAEDTARERNAQRADPWNAPLGARVQGARLYDGWRDLRELPAPVNVTGGWTDSVMVTPDGRRLYYGYSRYDFWQFFLSVSTPSGGGPQFIPTGPSRPGMTGDAFKIFQADLTPDGWIQTFHPLNGDPALSEASAAVNQSEDLIVFSRFPTGQPRAMHTSSKTTAGWSIPAPVPGVNSHCDDDNGFLIGDLPRGTTFYFESTRVDNAATACGSTHRLFRVYFPPAGPPTAIEPVPGLLGGDDSQPFISPDQREMYFTSVRQSLYGVFKADRQGNGDYGDIRPVITGTTAPPYSGRLVLLGEANIARVPQGELMVLMCGIAESESGGDPTDIRLAVCQARRP